VFCDFYVVVCVCNVFLCVCVCVCYSVCGRFDVCVCMHCSVRLCRCIYRGV
jgi:hypothetical protein